MCAYTCVCVPLCVNARSCVNGPWLGCQPLFPIFGSAMMIICTYIHGVICVDHVSNAGGGVLLGVHRTCIIMPPHTSNNDDVYYVYMLNRTIFSCLVAVAAAAAFAVHSKITCYQNVSMSPTLVQQQCHETFELEPQIAPNDTV